MNKSEQDLDLENLRADWQQGSASLPEISVTQLRRRLRWRWMGIVVDVLILVAVGALLTWMALNASGLAVWIYWGFFAAVYVVVGALGLRLRLAGLWRRDESAAAILDHARRDASLRQRSGRLGILTAAVTFAFVLTWLLGLGLVHELPLSDFLVERWPMLGFVSLWCGGFAAFCAWLREKGRRQILELDRLRQDLET